MNNNVDKISNTVKQKEYKEKKKEKIRGLDQEICDPTEVPARENSGGGGMGEQERK